MADKQHDICLQQADSEKLEHRVLKHTPEAIDQWARELRERFAAAPIAVCLELTKGPIVSALLKYDFFVPLSEPTKLTGHSPPRPCPGGVRPSSRGLSEPAGPEEPWK